MGGLLAGAFLLGLAAGFFIGVFLAHLDQREDEGTRTTDQFRKDQERYFSDFSGVKRG